MSHWAKYWDRAPRKVGKTEYRQQVGHTFKGKPYSDAQFLLMVSEICNHLNLKDDDVLLDVCCGNGLITTELSKKCKKTVGVDFSLPLLGVARRYHQPKNVSYQYLNVLNMDKMATAYPGQFSKILMYGALQYFKKQDIRTILQNLLRLSSENRIIFIGSIPDKARKWKFYNTPQKKILYLFYKSTGKDTIGTWWDKDWIKSTCKQLTLEYKFREQSIDRPVSHFRFDLTVF